MDDWGLIPGRGRESFFSTTRPSRLWGLHNLQRVCINDKTNGIFSMLAEKKCTKLVKEVSLKQIT
jgi:hypothetical protein